MSDKSKFRFATVHRVKRLMENVRMRELGQLMSQLQLQTDFQEDMKRQRTEDARNFGKAATQGIKACWAQTLGDRDFYFRGQIAQSQLLIEDQQKLIEAKRKEVELAYRERKMFDRLLEKHSKQQGIEQRRQVEKDLDEIVSTRFSRKANLSEEAI
jgi:flagellar export protein FliJ